MFQRYNNADDSDIDQNGDEVRWLIKLEKSLTKSIAVAFDLPDIQIPIDIEFDGEVEMGIKWTYTLGFGFAEKGGFYLMGGDDHKIMLQAGINTVRPTRAMARLLMLKLELEDSPLSFVSIDGKNKYSEIPMLGANANAEFGLNGDVLDGNRLFAAASKKASRKPRTAAPSGSTAPPKSTLFVYSLIFSVRLCTQFRVALGIKLIPSLVGTLDVGFTKSFDNLPPPPGVPAVTKSTSPSGMHINVISLYLDISELVNKVLRPALKDFCKTVEPIGEPLKVLTDDIEIVYKLAKESISILDILQEAADRGLFGPYSKGVKALVIFLEFLNILAHKDKGLCTLIKDKTECKIDPTDSSKLDPPGCSDDVTTIPPLNTEDDVTSGTSWNFAYLTRYEDMRHLYAGVDERRPWNNAKDAGKWYKCRDPGIKFKKTFYDLSTDYNRGDGMQVFVINHKKTLVSDDYPCVTTSPISGNGGILYQLKRMSASAKSESFKRSAKPKKRRKRRQSQGSVPKKKGLFGRLTDAESTKDNGGLLLDILSPAQALNLFLGKTATLFSLWAPELLFMVEFYFLRIEIPPGPIGLKINGKLRIEVECNLGVGFDTFGINKFIKSNDPLEIFDGIFLALYDRTDVTKKKPLVRFYGGITIEGKMDIFLVKGSAQATLYLESTLSLRDPDGDNKVRPSEIYALLSKAPTPGDAIMNLLDITLNIGWSVSASVDLCFGIPFIGRICDSVLSVRASGVIYKWSSPPVKFTSCGSLKDGIVTIDIDSVVKVDKGVRTAMAVDSKSACKVVSQCSSGRVVAPEPVPAADSLPVKIHGECAPKDDQARANCPGDEDITIVIGPADSSNRFSETFPHSQSIMIPLPDRTAVHVTFGSLESGGTIDGCAESDCSGGEVGVVSNAGRRQRSLVQTHPAASHTLEIDCTHLTSSGFGVLWKRYISYHAIVVPTFLIL